MLEDFGLSEQANVKKSLSEGLNDQLGKAFSQAEPALKKTKSVVNSFKKIEVAADCAAQIIIEEKHKFPDRLKHLY